MWGFVPNRHCIVKYHDDPIILVNLEYCHRRWIKVGLLAIVLDKGLKTFNFLRHW